MQAQKQIHASQLWQQGLNDVILKSCDTTVLKTLPLVVQDKIRWSVRKRETISMKKFACLIVTLWSFFWSVFSRIQSKYGKIRTSKNSITGHFPHRGLPKHTPCWRYTHMQPTGNHMSTAWEEWVVISLTIMSGQKIMTSWRVGF